MASNGDIMRLCRLCLVKDEVNIPIFDDHSSVQQIFMKISSCLPVTISKDDKLPKKICDGCSGKLDMLYQFWNTSAKAEKQLLLWLNQAGINFEKTKMDTNSSASEQSINKAVDSSIVKQENEDYVEGKVETSEISTEAKSYILQQQQLPYQKEFSFPEKDPVESGASVKSSETEEPPPKRARRAAAMKAPIQAIDSDDEDDEVDDIEPITKTEDESEDSGREEDNDPSFEPASVSADDQPGPSGVGKGSADASKKKQKRKKKNVDEDFVDFSVVKIKEEIDNSKLFYCPHCPKSFFKNMRLKKHLLAHSLERPYSCEVCSKKFKRKYEVTVHRRVHNSAIAFQCDFCLKVLRSKGSLTIHRKRHLKEYVATCLYCGAGFVTKQEYQNHVGSKHGQSTHICDICDRACYDKAALQSHRARHAEGYETNTDYKCDLCNKTFLQEKYLKHHFMRIHKNGGQRFICDHCGKRVNSKRSLRDHLLIHKGLKPIECPECDKKFALKTTLNLHLRTHTGDRPYECKDCGKAFTQRSSFKTHIRYHTGERPYKCEFCVSGFVSKGALTLHIRNKH